MSFDPFGSLVPNRHGSSTAYRYGFQGQEKDDELKGEGNSLNYTFRMHDPRVGRFFAVDPLTSKYPHYTPYSFSGNKVIQFVELEGLEESNTAAGSVIMGLLFPLPPKLKKEPWRSPGASAANMGAPIAAAGLGGVPIIVPAASALTTAYASYTTWYGTSLLSNYLAAGIGGTSSAFMADASGYFGASIWENSARMMFLNGSANAVGQIAYNGGLDSNFNYAQPLFAGLIGNPFLSNFGESFFNLRYDNGFKLSTNNFDSNFFSTFGSNLIGSKIGQKFEAPNGIYKPIKNVLDFTSGGAVETFENRIGDSIKEIETSIKSFSGQVDKILDKSKKEAFGKKSKF
ncbi:RHS repeat domain-containing protein [Flavobacterium sp.]|uniref:RHS repeat domain-containing protein n=1 Tax=Flavobacterium sp. TaxID=239 RepID=UPI0037520E8E